MARLYGEQCRLIDSQGGWIEGRDNCVEASRRFFALPLDYRLEVDEVVERGKDVLIRGRMRTDDPILAHDSLWRARADGPYLSEWQSYAHGEALPVARLLMPAVARSGWTGNVPKTKRT